jgi:hypothetical protein
MSNGRAMDQTVPTNRSGKVIFSMNSFRLIFFGDSLQTFFFLGSTAAIAARLTRVPYSQSSSVGESILAMA